ncbi:MAG: hypothetical protein NTX11_00945 [Candidatus Saccharibacteria bacterium]|nr:hypothetical protein [Candidatus Saccharibacteria bacterium]
MKNKLDYSGFFALSIFASMLNYLTYPVLARVLPSTQFVNVTVALSLLTQISTFLSSIVALTIGYTKLSNKSESAKSIQSLQEIVMSMFTVLIIIFVIASPYLLSRIDIPLFFILPICLLLLFSIPTSIISGYLNGSNKLTKLGVVAVMTASFQFIFSVTVGVLTKNGGLALLAMAFGQLVSIVAIILALSNDKLPSIIVLPNRSLFRSQDATTRKRIYFIVLASIGIMVVNLLQVVDLLVIKSRGVDVVAYTDLYIVSRVVFFAGSIFIWPFLASIQLQNLSKNAIPFLRIFTIHAIISCGAIVAMRIFGNEILNILIGRTYSQQLVTSLGALSIGYKFSFLVITSLVLYFIVINHRAAYIVPGLMAVAIAVFVQQLDSSDSVSYILQGLNVIGLVGVIVSIGFFLTPHLQRYAKQRR